MAASSARAWLVAGIAVLTGCTTTVGGAATPSAGGAAPAESAGPLTTHVGSLVLEGGSEDELLDVVDAAAGAAGAVLALVAVSGGDARLVELVPGAGGPEIVQEATLPISPLRVELYVTPSGGIVLAGEFRDGSATSLSLVVLESTTDDPEIRAIDLPGRQPDVATSVLSADGGTLYASLTWHPDDDGDDVPDNELVAVDVATGEIELRRPLDVGAPGRSEAFDLALRPDGGLTGAVYVDRNSGGSTEGVVLAEWDAQLRSAGEPVELLLGTDRSAAGALAVGADGSTVATVTDGSSPTTGDSQLVVVRDGSVAQAWDLEGVVEAPSPVVPDPGGRYLYLPHLEEDRRGELVTFDLDSGGPVATVPLCDEERVFDGMVVAADASTAMVFCGSNDGRPSAVLVS